MKIDFEWFRTFKHVFETESMSDAAKELCISQPGVSLHLNSLEAIIGYPLFERGPRKLTPTEKGKALYQQLQGAVTRLEDVERSFRKRSGKDRMTVSIGMFPGLYEQILEHHLSKFDFNIIMHLGTNDKLISLLENGVVDLAITTKEIHLRNVISEPLGESRFILVAGLPTDLSGFRETDKNNKNAIRRWLQSQIWYDTAERSNLNKFWKLNFHRDPDFYPNYIVPNNFSILHCLCHSSGLALLPESICREAIEQNKIIGLWHGYHEMKNKLVFGYRNTSLLNDEIQQVKEVTLHEFHLNHVPLL